ncbi:MAG: nucleotidyl transferase AbiEii/AbiGii toxin family protein [bacterium]|nr:nucleotidyl transferase AbiEii/AbiGii toxin family protein [bacterium]
MAKIILSPLQRKVLSILASDNNFTQNFYFTGGTVLANYYLHHRLSEDLDFFSEKEIDVFWLSILTKRIKEITKADKIDAQQSFNRNLVFFIFGEDVLKTEFTYFPFVQIEKPQIIDGLKIDSLIDISVNKFFTIYQKPSARHFIDLYLILKKKEIKWEELFKMARIKFDVAIDPIQLGSQLMMAEQAEDMPKMIIKLDKKEWQNYFLRKARELKIKIKK